MSINTPFHGLAFWLCFTPAVFIQLQSYISQAHPSATRVRPEKKTVCTFLSSRIQLGSATFTDCEPNTDPEQDLLSSAFKLWRFLNSMGGSSYLLRLKLWNYYL